MEEQQTDNFPDTTVKGRGWPILILTCVTHLLNWEMTIGSYVEEERIIGHFAEEDRRSPRDTQYMGRCQLLY